MPTANPCRNVASIFVSREYHEAHSILNQNSARCLVSHPMGRGPYFSHGVVNRFVQMRAGDDTSNRIHVSSAWAPGSSGSAILDECSNAIGLVSEIEMIQEPTTKQNVMSVNQAARVADLMKLVKQPQEVLH